MNSTPNANRLHIAIFGRCNSGKSSLINALTGQDTALVSAVPGTTTDLVNKAMEIHGIGPCVFIDTPGFDDEGELGEMRIARTLQAIERTDIALLLCEDGDLEEEQQWIQQLNSRHIPVILILNKSDRRECAADVAARIEKVCGKTPITVSAKEHTGIEAVYQAILRKLPTDFGQQTITGNLVQEGDLVLLVMPQDIQAPKGRLILPQVQTMRELLDKKCLVMSCTTDQLARSISPETRIQSAHLLFCIDGRIQRRYTLLYRKRSSHRQPYPAIEDTDSRSLHTCPSFGRHRQSKAPAPAQKESR